MKKYVFCFLTVIAVLYSSISFVFAASTVSTSTIDKSFLVYEIKPYSEIALHPYQIAVNQNNKLSVFRGFDDLSYIKAIVNDNGGIKPVFDSINLYNATMEYVFYSGFSDETAIRVTASLSNSINVYNNETIAWNFSIPIYGLNTKTIVGYLLPNPTGKPYTIEEFISDVPYEEHEPIYDLTNDWLSQTTEEGIYIIAPKSGKAFTLKDPAVNITVQYRYGDPLGKTGYQHLYASTDGTTFSKIADNDTSLSPFSGVMLSQDEKIVEHDGKPYKEGTLTYKLNVRKNIQLTLYAAMEKTDIVGLDLKPETFQSNRINLTWYDDFIDEDGDGNDDRDNDPDYHPSQDDQANNTDVSKFESITDVLNSLKGTLSGFISFITNFFKFIPSDIFILIGVGITIIILLRIFGR